MKETFNSGESFRQALNSVYAFHVKAYNTILAYLQEHGDYVIADKEDNPDGWNFCFLEMEGSYMVDAVRLDKSGNDFYLDTTSDSGDRYAVDWTTINHDMVIVSMLMGIVFPDNEKE